jgi:hypothetical protein
MRVRRSTNKPPCMLADWRHVRARLSGDGVIIRSTALSTLTFWDELYNFAASESFAYLSTRQRCSVRTRENLWPPIPRCELSSGILRSGNLSTGSVSNHTRSVAGIVMMRVLITDRHQVPRYLHDRISTLPASSGKRTRLDRFHNALSKAKDKEMLLEFCFWTSTADGHTCTYSAESSMAQNLDSFQEALTDISGREVAFCVININAGNDFESVVPWKVLDTTPSTTYVRRLLELIFQDRWPETCVTIEEDMEQLKERTPPQLDWNMELPSERTPPSGTPHGSLPLSGFDVTLEWPGECPHIDTLFGSQDWSIYVSEPYNQRPSLDALRIKDNVVPGSSSHRMTTMTSSGSMTKHLKCKHDNAMMSGAIDIQSPAHDQMLSSLLVSIRAVITETGRYIEESVKVLQQMVGLLRRASPSAEA